MLLMDSSSLIERLNTLIVDKAVCFSDTLQKQSQIKSFISQVDIRTVSPPWDRAPEDHPVVIIYHPVTIHITVLDVTGSYITKLVSMIFYFTLTLEKANGFKTVE